MPDKSFNWSPHGYFRWRPDERKRQFPIDFNLRSFYNEYKDELNLLRHDMGQYFSDQKWYTDTIDTMRYYPNKKHPDTERSQDNADMTVERTIPIETVEFFKSYLIAAKQVPELFPKKAAKKRVDEEGKGELEKVFWERFFGEINEHHLYNQVDLDSFFLKNIVHYNEYLRFTAKDLWEKEINTRYREIRRLFEDAAPTTQLEFLRRIMIELDRCISRLKENKHHDSPDILFVQHLDSFSSAESGLSDIFSRLLAYRLENAEPAEPFGYEYLVPDIQVPLSEAEDISFTLKSTFERLDKIKPGKEYRGPVNQSLLSKARSRYLEYLDVKASQKTIPGVANNYEQLNLICHYLKPIDSTQDIQSAVQYRLRDRIIQYCNSLLAQDNLGTHDIPNPLDRTNYEIDRIGTFVNEEFWQIIAQYSYFLHLGSYFVLTSPLWRFTDHIAAEDKPVDEMAWLFLRCFVLLWNTVSTLEMKLPILPNEFSVDDAVSCMKNIDQAVFNSLEEQSINADHFFFPDNLFLRKSPRDHRYVEYERAWEKCCSIFIALRDHEDTLPPFSTVLDAYRIIYRDVLVAALYRHVLDSSDRITNRIISLMKQ